MGMSFCEEAVGKSVWVWGYHCWGFMNVNMHEIENTGCEQRKGVLERDIGKKRGGESLRCVACQLD